MILQENMTRLGKNIYAEWLIALILMGASLIMMQYGYAKVSAHMATGKNQPIVTNFKYADKDIKKAWSTARPSVDRSSKKVDQILFEKIYTTNFAYTTNLYDVTFGQDMDGHISEGRTNCIVKAHYDLSLQRYVLYGTFMHMPTPRGGYYYEGWLVRKKPFDLISTGRIVLIDNDYSNVYASTQDLTDHTFFLVTVEHDDGIAIPETVLLEGEFKKL